jgi:hypothetical protein
MKMAKASKQEIDAAIELINLLDEFHRGNLPDEDDEEIASERFDESNREHLHLFYERVMAIMEANPGGMFRVVFGFATLMSNDVVDPQLDYLDHHPRIVAAIEREERLSQRKTILDPI